MNLIDLIEKEQITKEPPSFNVGDTVKVFFKIVEGNKERVQAFEGLVIARKNGGIRETFTVRKISFGVGVERTFPVHSPRITKVEVIREGAVRRAKLYYIRDLTGRAATRVKEKRSVNDKKVEVKSQDEKLATLKSNKAKATAPAKKAAATKKPATKAPAAKKPSETKRLEARATARKAAAEAPKVEEPVAETPAVDTPPAAE